MTNTEKLLNDWYQRVRVTQLAHYRSSDYYGKRKFWLGIPAVIISAIVGTTVFATIQQKPDVWIQILVGLASVIAALLTSLQTFLGYSERAERHRLAGAKYGALGRELEYLRTLTSIEEDKIIDIKKRLDGLAEESPNNRMDIYYKAGADKLEGG